jgi:hypothetical protein
MPEFHYLHVINYPALFMTKCFLFDFNGLELCIYVLIIYHNLNTKIADNIKRILYWIPQILLKCNVTIVYLYRSLGSLNFKIKATKKQF